MIERLSAGEVLGEMREALHLLEQVPAGSFIGPSGFESQPVEEAVVELKQKVKQQELLVAVYGSNFVDTTCEEDFTERHGDAPYDTDGGG